MLLLPDLDRLRRTLRLSSSAARQRAIDAAEFARGASCRGRCK
jgi:hypothetical protein